MSDSDRRPRLIDDVIAFIRDPESGSFSELALRVFAHQFEHIAAYRRVCERRGITPTSIRDWREVPPVPTLAFKHLALHTAEPERIFLTTGTTQGPNTRGRHAMPYLELYHAAAIAGLKRFLVPDMRRMRMASLVWPASERPESSLAQMIDWALVEFGSDDSAGCAADGRLDFDAFAGAVRRSEGDGQPLCIFTTTGALIHFFDHCRDRDWKFRLPHGSRLMDTGGAKGAPRPMSRNGILRAIWETFAIPGYFVVNEYGMTELSSQFYDNVVFNRVAGRFGPRALAGPPWMQTRVLDPATFVEVAPGETGLLCHFDLANAATAACVLTEDLGRVVEGGFEIVGRAAGAEARGCSLALEELVRA